MKLREQAMLFLKKAAEDENLLDEVLSSEQVSDEIFGFHCQQAAEKLMKAALSVKGIRFRKTHDLRELMDLLADNGIALSSELSEIDTLTPYGTLFRYDLLEDSQDFDRKSAREMIHNLRQWLKSEFGLAMS